MRWGWLVVIGACGDNLAAPVEPDAASTRPDAVPDAPVDTPPGAPNLTLIASQMVNSIVVTQDTFTSTSCEVVEQCVDATGQRRLLRFDTVTANLGTADVSLGAPPPAGESNGIFTWSACHGHHHVRGYATYELLDAGSVVITGHKQAFCLQDIEQVRAGAPSHGYACDNQGMSAGWADVYGRALPCQWIDVTTVAPGTYTLRVTINPNGDLPDSDPTDNEFTTTVTL